MVPRTSRPFSALVHLLVIIRMHRDLHVEVRQQRYETIIASTRTPLGVIHPILPPTLRQEPSLSPTLPLPKVNLPRTRPPSLRSVNHNWRYQNKTVVMLLDLRPRQARPSIMSQRISRLGIIKVKTKCRIHLIKTFLRVVVVSLETVRTATINQDILSRTPRQAKSAPPRLSSRTTLLRPLSLSVVLRRLLLPQSTIRSIPLNSSRYPRILPLNRTRLKILCNRKSPTLLPIPFRLIADTLPPANLRCHPTIRHLPRQIKPTNISLSHPQIPPNQSHGVQLLPVLATLQQGRPLRRGIRLNGSRPLLPLHESVAVLQCKPVDSIKVPLRNRLLVSLKDNTSTTCTRLLSRHLLV